MSLAPKESVIKDYIQRDRCYPVIHIDSGEEIYLGEQVSSVDTANNIAKSSQLAREVCKQIDGEISPLLNKLAGTQQMRFALAIASYKAHIQATIYFNLAQALELRSSELDGQAVTCLDAHIKGLIHSRFKFPEIIGRFLPHSRIEVQSAPVSSAYGEPSFFQRFYRAALLVKNNPSKSWERIFGVCRVFGIRLRTFMKRGLGAGKGRILMFSPYLALHDLGANSFHQYELLLCSERSFNARKTELGRGDFERLAEKICSQSCADNKTSSDQVIRDLLVDDVLQELAYCLWNKNYLAKLILLRQKLEKRPVGLGIWCIPPVFHFDSIVFEFLLSNGVPVIGSQHGGLNGCQHHVEMMTVDLLRCTDFVSWGFSKEDLSRVFPHEQTPCQIYPLGWMRAIPNAASEKNDFDLLFPLTGNCHMFRGGMLREKPELLLEKQIRLLEYLDELVDVKIAVKPFPGANQWNCAVYDRLMKLRNVKVFWDISLVSFIEKYRFRGVLVEHPSTPLYEILNLDVEIFLHLDSVLEIESLAFEKLERRVYCFHGVDPMIRAISSFLEGKLLRRRDKSFYQHYVSRAETKERYFGLVDKLLSDATG